MAIETLSPAQAQAAIKAGATLVDIRSPDEHAREHIAGAVDMPLDRLDCDTLPDGAVIFHCRSGMRTRSNADTLAAAAQGRPCYILDGGIDAWRACGQATAVDRKQPLELMRQVQLAAGGLVLLGVILGFLVGPAFFGLSAFVGAGLMMAGATGWCGMATLLRHMPWNRALA
ncbi:MAG TPA: rhodanese family protein [Sphingobium sp.]|nr:rhodanese family protein [Sphingobium sp.]